MPAERMIGRSEDVTELSGTLANGIHRIVAGPRRTGKTSVCRAAVERLARERHYTVSVDLFEVANQAVLAEALVAGTVANRAPLRRLVSRARELGLDALRAAAMRTVIKTQLELGEEVEIAFQPGFAERDPDRYFTYAMRLLDKIAARDRRQLILFVDELQELAAEGRRLGDPDALTKRMRAILQDSRHVTCLFAGSVEHLMRDLFAPSKRAFHQFGGFFDLSPIAAEAWEAGLEARFAEDRVRIEAVALRRIVELGELHPRATMLIAQQTHNASAMLGTRRIAGALVEQGYREARVADRRLHELSVERVRAMGTHTFAVAQRVARGAPPYAGLSPTSANRALGALRDAGLIEQPARGAWRISDPLLRRYLAELDPVKL